MVLWRIVAGSRPVLARHICSRYLRVFTCSASNNLHTSSHRNEQVADDSKTLAQQYDRDGYVIVKNAVEPSLAAEMQGHVDWLLKRFPELPPEQLHHPLIEYDAFWLRVASEPRLVNLARQLIGDDVALFASHYFCKMPRTGQEVLWHQDGAYWPLDPMEVVSLWVAVDRSDSENGCLRVVPSSHKQPLKELSRSSGNDALSSYAKVEVDEKEVVDMVLEPGDVEIHHPNIIHGSQANTSDRRRCGLTIRYIPTSTRVTVPPDHPIVPMNWLLHGKAVHGVNLYKTWPAYNPSYSYSFHGCEDWNSRAEVLPEAVRESLTLSSADVKAISLGKVRRVMQGLQEGY